MVKTDINGKSNYCCLHVDGVVRECWGDSNGWRDVSSKTGRTKVTGLDISSLFMATRYLLININIYVIHNISFILFFKFVISLQN